ncbi:hypothetical protein GJ496_009309 [Pomphorhynchus laevis]|nr:hypothetical protein GJ496_009309 [Pomphorhynchus laevis]
MNLAFVNFYDAPFIILVLINQRLHNTQPLHLYCVNVSNIVKRWSIRNESYFDGCYFRFYRSMCKWKDATWWYFK